MSGDPPCSRSVWGESSRLELGVLVSFHSHRYPRTVNPELHTSPLPFVRKWSFVPNSSNSLRSIKKRGERGTKRHKKKDLVVSLLVSKKTHLSVKKVHIDTTSSPREFFYSCRERHICRSKKYILTLPPLREEFF